MASMAYHTPRPNQLVYFTNAFAEYFGFVNSLQKARVNSFQTQSARDEFRSQLIGSYKVVVSKTVRFPETGFFVYLNDPVIKPIYEALMKSFDTKNRIIEVEEESRPTTAETLNATQRVDDATVAIHKEITNLMNELVRGTGFLNRSSFESTSGLTWSTAPTTAEQ